jgi:hypothetical protein
MLCDARARQSLLEQQSLLCFLFFHAVLAVQLNCIQATVCSTTVAAVYIAIIVVVRVQSLCVCSSSSFCGGVCERVNSKNLSFPKHLTL